MGENVWWEQTAAASSTLGLFALLALAAEADLRASDAQAVDSAYHPWINLACTLLDCFADRDEDARTGAHNYLERYDDGDEAIERLRYIVARATREAELLHQGRRHAVITAAMIAMYLSKRSVQSPGTRPVAHAIALAGGPLTILQTPMLRGMRWLHGVRD